MKSTSDHFTGDMFGNHPGRPRKVNAMTVAQRVRKHRATKALAKVSVTGNGNCVSCDGVYSTCSGLCKIGQLG